MSAALLLDKNARLYAGGGLLVFVNTAKPIWIVV